MARDRRPFWGHLSRTMASCRVDRIRFDSIRFDPIHSDWLRLVRCFKPWPGTGAPFGGTCPDPWLRTDSKKTIKFWKPKVRQPKGSRAPSKQKATFLKQKARQPNRLTRFLDATSASTNMVDALLGSKNLIIGSLTNVSCHFFMIFCFQKT